MDLFQPVALPDAQALTRRPAAGLKATFTTSYMHTVIIYIVCLVFAFKVYTPGNLLAGIDQACMPAPLHASGQPDRPIPSSACGRPQHPCQSHELAAAHARRACLSSPWSSVQGDGCARAPTAAWQAVMAERACAPRGAAGLRSAAGDGAVLAGRRQPGRLLPHHVVRGRPAVRDHLLLLRGGADGRGPVVLAVRHRRQADGRRQGARPCQRSWPPAQKCCVICRIPPLLCWLPA